MRHEHKHTDGHGARTAACPDSPAEATSTLCHDLRQVVTAALLLSRSVDERSDRDTLLGSLSLLRRTLEHAAEILDEATAQVGTPPVLLDLRALAEQCVALADPTRDVTVAADSTQVLVLAEPVLLRRAVQNLVTNAARAVGEHGVVVVRTGRAAGASWIEVVDDGPGFGEIEPGTGQGLSVVSSAVRSCGGRLHIESGPGPGTTVRLSFPVLDETGGTGGRSA